MKTSLRVFVSVCLCLFVALSTAEAKRTNNGKTYGDRVKPREAPLPPVRLPGDGLETPLAAPPAASTTFLAYYTFDSHPACTEQGWTSHDLTEQPGDYWHVTDFATGGEACGPGTFGRLVVLEGDQSLWCGACPDENNLTICNYAALPGYGNDWNQAFCTKTCLSVDSNVVIDYLAAWDSEPGYDYTTVEVDNCDDGWVVVAGGLGIYDIVGGGFESIAVPNDEHSGALRVRFRFESDGGWSDQDGLFDSDGAFVLDSLSVSDASGTVLAVEDFEGEQIGDNDASDWETCTTPGYGDLAQLQGGVGILQEDPCVINLSCMWNFYKGSTFDYSCNNPPAPQQKVVPYGNDRDQYLWNEIRSPAIAWTGSGSEAKVRFDVYRDLPLDNLVFFTWRIRSNTGDCPPPWAESGFVYYGDKKDWARIEVSFGDLVGPGTTDVQIALVARDMCGFWCPVYGHSFCHSHAPLFDNVEVYRVDLDGPQFSWRDIDDFQDNFSTDGTITGTVRIDMANDELPYSNPGILPGDSAVIGVNDPEVGLAGDINTGWGPAVYTYVAVLPQGKYTGDQIQASDTRGGNPRWPWVGDVVLPKPYSFRWPQSTTATWHVFRHDSCFTPGGGLISDSYCIDFNDNLFVPGDTVYFFRGAINAGAVSRYHTGGRESSSFPGEFGSTDDISLAALNADEMTCLPANGLSPGENVLYVDGMNFRNAQWMFDSALEFIDGEVDRYDIRGPSSAVGNHPASRVVDPVAQLANVYRVIIWNTGDLRTAFSDGWSIPDKSDDMGMLKSFLDNLPNTGGANRSGGIYLSGDDVATRWFQATGASASALRTYLSYTVMNDDHVDAGLGVSPWVIGTPGGAFEHQDTMVAYGGCPVIEDFDVLTPSGTAVLEADYVNYVGSPGPSGGAIVSQTTANPGGALVGFMLSGFSFHHIANQYARSTMERLNHMDRILRWMNLNPPFIIGENFVSENRYFLNQNYPNPFNPTTTIAYAIKEPGHVSLRVYNVAGQLVKTLVDEIQRPDAVTPVHWDGRNNAGERVSSGVYFYKLVSKGFTKTKKMVLLK